MLQEWGRMPEPLKKQILLRLGLGVLFLILLIVLAVTAQDVYLWLPCAAAAALSILAAFLLFRRVMLGEYVVVSGECAEVSLTAVKRRAKYLILQTEVYKLKVMLRGGLRKISAGTNISLYIANNTPVYEQNGLQMLYTYIAIVVK